MARAWFTSRLTHQCIVQRDAGTARSSRGQVDESWSTLGTYAGRLYEDRHVVANESIGAATVKVTFWEMDSANDIAIHDRIHSITDARGSAAANGTFTVQDVVTVYDVRGDPHHVLCQVESVQVS